MSDPGVPEVDIIFVERPDVQVYPADAASPMVVLELDQRKLVADFNTNLEKFEKQFERETQVLQQRTQALKDEQNELIRKHSTGLADVSGVQWNQTSQGQKLELAIESEFGKDIDFPSAVQFAKNIPDVEKFITDWRQHIADLRTRTDVDISLLPTAPGSTGRELLPTERVISLLELTRINTYLGHLTNIYDKFVPTTNLISVTKHMLGSKIGDLEVIDASSGLTDPSGGRLSILPPNYAQLKQLLGSGVMNITLDASLDPSRGALVNALGTSAIVSPEMVTDPNFMQSAVLVHLNEYFQLQLKTAEFENSKLRRQLSLEYLTFTNKLAEIKLSAIGRVERDFNLARRVQLAPDPRIPVLRQELADLALEIEAAKNYLPAAKAGLQSTLRDLNQTTATLEAELASLLKKFADSNIMAKLIWPKIGEQKFNLGIIARMKNEDVGSKTFPVLALDPKPEGAKMTVSTLNDKVRTASGEADRTIGGTKIPVDPPGSCDKSDTDSYREYQKFIAAYLFGPDEPPATPHVPGSGPEFFPISPYRGILANWGVGTGKTKGGMKAMIDFFDNFDRRYDNGTFAPHEADMSNWIQLWVPNQNVLNEWARDIESTFKGRIVKTDPNLFNDITQNRFLGHWYLNNNANINGWSQSRSKALWIVDSGDRSKYITANLTDVFEVADIVWAQIPTSFIFHKLRFPGIPAVDTTYTIPQAIKKDALVPSLWHPVMDDTATPPRQKTDPSTGLLLWTIVADPATRLPALNPSNTQKFEDAITELWTRPDIRRYYARKLKQFSPFVIFDEVHNWNKPPLNSNADQKKWLTTTWTDRFPNWCWSKFLALSATPFNIAKPDFTKLAHLIQLLKYFPDEQPADKTYSAVFPAGLTLGGVIPDVNAIPPVVSTPEMDIFFSGWLSYVSLNFDTTLYPYYKSLVCTNVEDNFCVSDSREILKLSTMTDADFVATFKETNFADVPGQSKNQSVIRSLREWKYTVPNLINVYLTKPSVDEIAANWAAWTTQDEKPIYRQGRFLNLDTFKNDDPPTAQEQTLILPDRPSAAVQKTFDTPKITTTPFCFDKAKTSDLRTFWNKISTTAGQTVSWTPDLLEKQCILDIVGYTGTKIKMVTEKDSDNNDVTFKTIEEGYVVSQPLVVGGKVGAREKGEVCAKMLTSLPGKFIFVQTSINNSPIVYNYFWNDFWAAFPPTAATPPASIEIFQEIPVAWDLLNRGKTAKPSTNPNDPAVPDPWWPWDVSTDMSGPSADPKKKDFPQKSDSDITAAVDAWYTTNVNDKRIRGIFLASKYETVSKPHPLFTPIFKFWQALYNDARNFDGSYFKGIFLNPASVEGLNLFDVNYHVNLNPPQSITVKTQAEGRGFRQCAHTALAWHSTTVTAEIDASGTTVKYNLDAPPANGIYPEVKMITLIASIDPMLASLSPMQITPDELMASSIYKDPSMAGDFFLRYLQGLAVDSLLFGAYSHIELPPGVEAQAEGQWYLAKELVLQAASYVRSNPAGRKKFVDYVKRFYHGSLPSGAPPGTLPSPPGITAEETAGKDPRDVYKKFLNSIAKQTTDAFAITPALMKDLFARLVYFAGDSIEFPSDETLLSSPGKIFSFAFWRGTNLPVGNTRWFKNYVSALAQEKNDPTTGLAKTILSSKLTIIENQAKWIKEMSEQYVKYMDNFTLSSYFAQNVYPKDTFVPELGYYERLDAKTPNTFNQADWFKDAITWNLNKGKGAYKTKTEWVI